MKGVMQSIILETLVVPLSLGSHDAKILFRTVSIMVSIVKQWKILIFVDGTAFPGSPFRFYTYFRSSVEGREQFWNK